ncbi:hypothetical protein FEM48_Zijuj12G0188900 [Ziziphus jujuba var. spinosa]|uniref:Uncharacterized protein n=1 Tax=Ziziphus jujuba var. spinosa TaxID=714518 RepID=A0A978UEY9_ZIZJJ|nr:hypothetical protein FEM48_Zijuj12G0188900 [Ziziphus jujuba var. spinosa]
MGLPQFTHRERERERERDEGRGVERRRKEGFERQQIRTPSLSTLIFSFPTQKKPIRLAHPGGPLTTNKAAALAKFLERKLQEPNGLASLNPDLIELAVNNAKNTVFSSISSPFPLLFYFNLLHSLKKKKKKVL